MADKYPNFATLALNERSGIDYRVLVRRAKPALAIIAPHGGGIEPGTSEIADAIADVRFSFYAFEGLKSSGNAALHITSTRFDEPMCLNILAYSGDHLHHPRRRQRADGEGVFVGGLDVALGKQIGGALTEKGFDVREHTDPSFRAVTRKTCVIGGHPVPASSWSSPGQCERRCSNRSRGPDASTRRRGSPCLSTLFVKFSNRAAEP